MLQSLWHDQIWLHCVALQILVLLRCSERNSSPNPSSLLCLSVLVNRASALLVWLSEISLCGGSGEARTRGECRLVQIYGSYCILHPATPGEFFQDFVIYRQQGVVVYVENTWIARLGSPVWVRSWFKHEGAC